VVQHERTFEGWDAFSPARFGACAVACSMVLPNESKPGLQVVECRFTINAPGACVSNSSM